MSKKIEQEKIEDTTKKENKRDYEFIAQIAIVAVLVFLLAYNFGKFSGTGKVAGINSGNTINNAGTVSASEIIPKGVPEVYGKELGVSYDDVSAANTKTTEAAIGVLANLDNSITLSGDNLQRYIKIGSEIACEYCCGAETLVFSNGQAACGCAHSYAMRGLAKYLIKNHGNEVTDDQILEELGKWKVLFFPDVHETKAAVLKSKGIELNYINLASNKYRGIETGQENGGSMVGGC